MADEPKDPQEPKGFDPKVIKGNFGNTPLPGAGKKPGSPEPTDEEAMQITHDFMVDCMKSLMETMAKMVHVEDAKNRSPAEAFGHLTLMVQEFGNILNSDLEPGASEVQMRKVMKRIGAIAIMSLFMMDKPMDRLVKQREGKPGEAKPKGQGHTMYSQIPNVPQEVLEQLATTQPKEGLLHIAGKDGKPVCGAEGKVAEASSAGVVFTCIQCALAMQGGKEPPPNAG